MTTRDHLLTLLLGESMSVMNLSLCLWFYGQTCCFGISTASTLYFKENTELNDLRKISFFLRKSEVSLKIFQYVMSLKI